MATIDSAMDRDGDRATAIHEFRQAAHLGNEPEYLFRLAYALDLAGEEDEALACYEQVVQMEPPYLNALINLAVIYEDRGEVGRAEKACEPASRCSVMLWLPPPRLVHTFTTPPALP